ncbi:DNA replication and repair protein RecF [Candidatus Peribacteria bacterium]|jgi:DNA replication and repair protein RecF|nr:DNA replication and repair protein RecF [Candidatus Peribacteria bacterium]MBT4021494.1 DNA replication and repair protein RecF [Candidatus Peribacteria bacterium]MBT4240404.1 DNA replication and repair protein RecF [Candidatus Peribacteria bacterium]MBT4473827.1 DNA replication and repair protein RecF [Candidatus Peribacteria bacterium]
MRLTSLKLESFRSYQTLSLEFNGEEKPVMLLGENATGKTNVLEAVSILALLKSQRKAHETDMISWEQSHYRITGILKSDTGEEKTLEVVSQVIPRKQRGFFVNGVRTPAQRYVGTLPLITFAPDDLDLFTGSPGGRRRFVDQLLCQVSSSYLQALSEYEKSLKQRNTMLKQIREGICNTDSLNIWDEKIATLGSLITVDRLRLFERLQNGIFKELIILGEKPSSSEFKYIRKTSGLDDAQIRSELIEQLAFNRERDIIIANTTTGPHRDDWILEIDSRDISTFASRGQQRAALLALLLLQSSFLEERKSEKPVLLLDDIFSEFDEKHRTAVLNGFSQNQVIITGVELDEKLRDKAQILACPLS